MYPVSVRQVTALLHASLEPCLTTTLLRFANTSPPSGCVEDFHLQVAEHARHTKKGIPIGIATDGVVTKDVSKGELLTEDNFVPDASKFIYELRQKQNSLIEAVE